MNMGLLQSTRQTLQQRIIMTPKLQQAINVLLMSKMELAQFMTQQLEQNPLLEEVLDIELDIDESGNTEEFDPDSEWNEPEESLDREDKEPDIDFESFMDDSIRPSVTVTSEHPDNDDGPQSDVARYRSLHDFLLEQLNMSSFSDVERKIGELIIGNLNDDGQLKMPLFDISPKFQADLDDGAVNTGTVTKRLHKELEKKLSVELQLSSDFQRLLFYIDWTTEIELELQYQIPQIFRQRFTQNSLPLSYNAKISTVEADKQWLINDADNNQSKRNGQTYVVKKEHEKFNVYLQNDHSLLSANLSVTVKVPETCWVIHDEDTAQTYTVKKGKGNQLNVYGLTLEEIADEIGCDLEAVEEVLHYIQENFEPKGIAYRTFPEALLIQMRVASIEDRVVEAILENHFEDYLNNQIPRIARHLNVSTKQVIKAGELIRNLPLYPGRHFIDPDAKYLQNDDHTARYVIPEATIEKIDGEYKVTTDDDGMPRLRLNPFYLNMLRNGHYSLDSETKQWLERQRSNAIDLLSSITERHKTIANVTKAIFEVQHDFLEQGVKGLKPLTLREIADMAGVHESTVSRVTTNKYVDTPQGVFPLKFFFSSDLSTDTGSNISATVVKEEIKEIIQNEDTAKPLSDQAIANILSDQGINTARRTITKYREEMDILSSSKRKRVW